MLAGRSVPPPPPFGTRHDFSIYGLGLWARAIGDRGHGRGGHRCDRRLDRDRDRRERRRVRDPLGGDRVHDHDQGVAPTAFHARDRAGVAHGQDAAPPRRLWPLFRCAGSGLRTSRTSVIRSPGVTAPAGAPRARPSPTDPSGTSPATGPARAPASRVPVMASPAVRSEASTRPTNASTPDAAPGGASEPGYRARRASAGSG